MVLNELYHSFAGGFHKLVKICCAVTLVLVHKLILGFVGGQRYLGNSQDLLIEIIIAVKLHHKLVLFKNDLSLCCAQAKSRSHSLRILVN